MVATVSWPQGIDRPPDPRPADFARWQADGEWGHLIALQRVEAVGSVRLRAALAALGSPRAIWRAPEERLAAIPGFGLAAARALAAARRESDPDGELERAWECGMALTALAEPAYPERLRHIFDPPLLLLHQGPVPEWSLAVAVVGTRRSTHYGETQAYRLGRDLASAGVLVISGLARGIDAATHRGALDAGGRTTAFLGGSVDRFWPPENCHLKDRMLAAGMALYSEYPPGMPPRQWRFPARNRLVAAIAHAVVVVEAPARSGAMITATQAADYATDVMAVPGPADSARFAGSHQLLREGARLVRHADDVLADLGWGFGRPTQLELPIAAPDLDETEAAVLQALSGAGDRPDDLAARLALPVSTVLVALSGLQLKDRIARRAGPTFFRQ